MQREGAHGALRKSRAVPTIWIEGGVQCRGGVGGVPSLEGKEPAEMEQSHIV